MGSVLVDEGGSLQEKLRMLTFELHDFVTQVQKPRWNDSAWLQAAYAHSLELNGKIENLKLSVGSRKKELESSMKDALEEVSSKLSEYSVELKNHKSAVALKQKWKSLSYSYEELFVQLRKYQSTNKVSLKVGHLKPINYSRNIFHMCMGTAAVLAYEFFLTYNQALGLWCSFVFFLFL